MKTFKAYLGEMSIAMKGDWEPEGKYAMDSISQFGINKSWKLLATIATKLGEYEVRKLKNDLQFIMGFWYTYDRETKRGSIEETRFIEVFKLHASRKKRYEKAFNVPHIINIDGVYIEEGLRTRGITTTFYKYLVNEMGYTILGDEKQYFGARKLWSRLSDELDVVVDIVDVKVYNVLYENVILHHGHYDEDFDKRLWSYEGDKKNLRSILKRIA